MLTETKVRQKLQHWEIGSILNIENGEIGDRRLYHVFHINNQYIFKVGKNISDIETHIQIAKYLKTKDIGVSTPIKTKDGKEYVINKDGDYEVLLQKVKGKALSTEQRYHQDRVEVGKKYGLAIGHLHQALCLEEQEFDVPTNNLVENMLNWALPETEKFMKQWDMGIPDEFFTDCNDKFRHVISHLPTQVIHRDIHPSNVIFDNGEVSGFIDFEISERNVRIFDPCYCATGILSEGGFDDQKYEEWLDLLKGIMMGYHAICPLSDAEKKAVLYIIYSIQCVFIAWLGDKEEYRELSRTNRNMLYWLYQNRAKIQSIMNEI